jgi:hypothetical protein
MKSRLIPGHLDNRSDRPRKGKSFDKVENFLISVKSVMNVRKTGDDSKC